MYDKDEIKQNITIEQMIDIVEALGASTPIVRSEILMIENICHNLPGESRGHKLYYYDREYAGFGFDAIIFTFQSDGYNTYFNECHFVDRFTDITLAKKFKNILLAKLSAKYDTPTTGIDDKGLPWALGGVSPVSDYEPGYHLFITKDDKDKFYYVHLRYGPYNYANEEF